MTRPSWPKAVVFDLDGTLVDSAADIGEALNAAFEPMGLGAFSLDDVKQMIGGGSAVLVARAAERAGLTLDDGGRAELLAHFMTVYKEVSALGRGLFPGALTLLEGLRGASIRTALCTNKPAPVTEIAVRALGLTPWLDHVVGASDSLPKKPAPDMLLACCHAFDVHPRDVVMVGDSGADAGAARAAGAGLVLVDFGYSKAPVSTLGADAVVSHLADIPRVLARLGRA